MSPSSAAFMLFHSVTCLVLLILFAITFVNSVYVYVAPQYGGGKSRKVEIAVTDQAVRSLTLLGIPMKGNVVANQVEMVDETTDNVDCLIGDKTIVLPRSQILVIETN